MSGRGKTFFAFLMLAASASLLAEPPLLRQARQALDEFLPQVAIEKLRTFLASPETLSADHDVALLQLGEALLATGEYEEALLAIQPLLSAGLHSARLLQAHAFAGAGRWASALPIYHELAAPAGGSTAATLGEVESLHALGRTREAVKLLEPFCRAHPGDHSAGLRLASLWMELRESKKARQELKRIRPSGAAEVKWKSYLEGRLLLLEDQPAPALITFEELLARPEGLSEHLLVGAALGSAEARIIMNGYDAADVVLEQFIWKHEDSALLELVFRRLDQVYTQQDKPSDSELKKWVQEAPLHRAALARFYLARLQARARKPDRAAASLDQLVRQHPSHPLLPQVHLMQADLLLEKRDVAGAVRALEAAMRQAKSDEQRAEIELRTALLHVRQGEHLLAANFFQRAGERSPARRERALFGSALAWLNQQNEARFLDDYRALSARWPGSPRRGELILEQGLQQARAGDPRAGETLQLYLRDFPQAARKTEAHLALAELAFADGDAAATTRYLRVVNEAAPSQVASDQAEYLQIFLADAQTPRDEEKVIELALRFTRAHEKSPLLAPVRMKLGQLYFHREDFPNAETQFTLLVQQNAESPYVETALFLAGQAAMKTINPAAIDRALALFERVAARGGPLKLYARQQQAIVQSKLGKESEAITLYENILGAQPPPDAELRFAALCGKGDNLLALGRRESKQLEEAIAVYDQLAALPGVTAPWRNQALYKKANAFEQRQRVPEALAAYYDVLAPGEGAEGAAAEGSREYFWYYKAGFDAARLFEQQEQWKSAIGIYEKMSKLEGPRAGEARARVKQLRLAHFVWE